MAGVSAERKNKPQSFWTPKLCATRWKRHQTSRADRVIGATPSVQAAIAILLALLAAEVVPVPSDPGLYFLSPRGLTRIEARTVSLASEGNKLTSTATLGVMKRGRVTAEIVGATAEHKVTSAPVFYYRTAAGSDAARSGAADLVLVRLKRKRDRRRFEIGTQSDWKASAGISLRSQVDFSKKQVESGLYKLIPAQDLEPGEYGFYVFRGNDLPGIIYDFAVD